ncbi:MAG: DUF1002 domain-containing protein [Clostridia bacterium]|nr:DUF1002 domain-containing protein [Clostridia bacterium]
MIYSLKIRIISIVLVLTMLVVSVPSIAFAKDVEGERVTLGADLDESQIAKIYDDFGIERGSVKELKVTNDEERDYLEGLVPDRKIGKVALSCIYIKTEGEGLSISTNNINWCTSQMYVNALTTAGIRNAVVKVSAPYEVSGTAALTGIYKAYEDITGEKLPELNKEVGTEELVTTGQLAELIGSNEATQIINELKKMLGEIKNMTDAELKQEIRRIADTYNVEIDDEMINRLVALCRQMEKLDIDALREGLLDIAAVVDKASKASSSISNFFAKIGDFFTSIFDFFANLFGKK